MTITRPRRECGSPAGTCRQPYPWRFVIGGNLRQALEQAPRQVVGAGELTRRVERLHLLGEVGRVTRALRRVTLQPERDALATPARLEVTPRASPTGHSAASSRNGRR